MAIHKNESVFSIKFDIKDVELYINTKYSCYVEKSTEWDEPVYWAVDQNGSKRGKAIEMFKNDFKNTILTSMIDFD